MRKDLRSARWLGVLVSVAAYLLALLAAVLVVLVAGLGHPLADLALGTLVATAVVFLISMAADNSSIYDPYWSVQPLAFAGYYLWTGSGEGGGIDARQVIAVCLVFLYALRLTSNFYRDWPGLGKEDFRYRLFRERFGRFYWPLSFAGIHLFPTLMVYLGCLPLYAVFRSETNGLDWLDWAGAAVLLGAIIMAFVADEQLRAFRALPANQGRIVRSGLWARTRHPNYLGEISSWWGLWLFALGAGGRWWWTLAGAAAITVMFVFASIPMMERRLLRTRAGYAEYRQQTGMLAPRLFGRTTGTERSDPLT